MGAYALLVHPNFITMNAKQLREKLVGVPDDAEVVTIDAHGLHFPVHHVTRSRLSTDKFPYLIWRNYNEVEPLTPGSVVLSS